MLSGFRASSIVRRLPVWLAAAVLTRSAVYHLENPFAFLRAVDTYRLTSPAVSVLLSATLPFLMLSGAIAMCFVTTLRKQALIIGMAIAVVFTIAQATTWFRGIEIDCGCFGNSKSSLIGFRTISVPVLVGICCAAGLISLPANSRSKQAR